jgi:hypothetical protein
MPTVFPELFLPSNPEPEQWLTKLSTL